MKNKAKCLSEHIERYPEQWFNYLNGKDFAERNMTMITFKDDDGNSIHSSDLEEDSDIYSSDEDGGSMLDLKNGKMLNDLSGDERSMQKPPTKITIDDGDFSSESLGSSDHDRRKRARKSKKKKTQV